MARRKMLVADLLCGAGGSSTGCARALAELGLEMDLVCVNHWPVAIETHRKNHPEARHYVQDISTVRPHLIVPEGYLDLLMASPTCTHHSVARGGKPTSDQQRSDPWHIITWLTELRVNCDEQKYEFAGTKTEKIKQIGNAVSVSKMRACVSAIMADAARIPAAHDLAQRAAE